MRVKYNRLDIQARKKLAMMISELKLYPKKVFQETVGFVPFQSDDVLYNRMIWEINRAQIEWKHSFGSELPVNRLVDRLDEVREQYYLPDNIEFYASIESEPVPYEDYDRDASVVTFYYYEDDVTYFRRIHALYERVMSKPRYSADKVLVLFKEINNTLYIARHITYNEQIIRECLDDLGSLYNGEYNDHNGEASDIEMAEQLYKIQTRLMTKYGVLND